MPMPDTLARQDLLACSLYAFGGDECEVCACFRKGGGMERNFMYVAGVVDRLVCMTGVEM